MNNQTYTTEEWIEKAKSIHGNKYRYDRFVYKNAYEKMEIYCNECEKYFIQTTREHLRGNGGCLSCKAKASSKLFQKTQEQFILDAQKIHGNKYDYSSVVYVKSWLKVKIFCNTCKEFFFQRPNEHLCGKGCTSCKYKKISSLRRKSQQQFEKDSREVHGDKYGYEKSDYKGNKIKVKIYCNKCERYFYCSPGNHIQQKIGCPVCNPNESENELLCVKFLRESLDESYSITTSNKDILKNPETGHSLEIDIIIRKKDKIVLYVEWNGKYWHSFDSVIKRDKLKKRVLGDQLIQIIDEGSINPQFVKETVDTIILPRLLESKFHTCDG